VLGLESQAQEALATGLSTLSIGSFLPSPGSLARGVCGVKVFERILAADVWLAAAIAQTRRRQLGSSAKVEERFAPAQRDNCET
jgi:hypothetical protein